MHAPLLDEKWFNAYCARVKDDDTSWRKQFLSRLQQEKSRFMRHPEHNPNLHCVIFKDYTPSIESLRLLLAIIETEEKNEIVREL